MGNASRYWTLAKLNSAGQLKREEIASAKAFFKQQFPDFNDRDVPDSLVQSRLMQLMSQNQDLVQLSQLCLRCFISDQVQQVCIQLEARFGERHGFTRKDLFPFVLDDDGKRGYQSFAIAVLSNFDPARSSLATWTSRLVRHHRELNAFLLECGVYLLSDWAILNDTTPRKLEQVFTEVYPRTSLEVCQAIALLNSYHEIYRQKRLRQRLEGTTTGHCPPPTPDQLEAISHRLRQKVDLTLAPETVLTRLQSMAERLRQHRIAARRGTPETEALTTPDLMVTPDVTDEHDPDQFLQLYRQQFADCLQRALQRVVSDRLQTIKPPKNKHFVTALQLFHCQKMSMTEIATRIGLKAQFEVSRLLKLKEFRADVRHWMLNYLRDGVAALAKDFIDPNQLQTRDAQIEAALNQQIEEVIGSDEKQANTPKNFLVDSLFARKLCEYLDGIG
ncbi:hypothetical protein J5X98_12610 [Leptothermofonsia sichuanensis E412]|uniref:hypothetical protein n=1 Tax=Leptothermofonsia sichuanensis TaxID=2917832 RepID=UPI001CA638CC|nr:hypothetical protein [Leptothermofonsia sichuanensis]QZZ23095.1 hypothetical protein J5X98_12610 [Leptothermofonsia sichuanensis E412]